MKRCIAVVLAVMIGVFGMYTKHNFASGETLYASQLNEMDEQIYNIVEDLNNYFSGVVPIDTVVEYSSKMKVNKYYAAGFVGQPYANAGSTNGNYQYSTSPIDVDGYAGCDVIVKFSQLSSTWNTGNGRCLFCDANGIIIAETRPEKEVVKTDESGSYSATYTIPDGSTGFLVSYRIDDVIAEIRIIGTVKVKQNSREIAFVSTSGDDTNNDGTYEKPYATVTKALDEGYRDIRMMGGVYKQQIDIRGLSTDNPNISISAAEHTTPVVFTPPNNIAKITSASAYSDKVYMATMPSPIISSCNYIYMDGIADPRTSITIEDRHPSQRGNSYRCPDIVRIAKCASIAEIEAATDYMWYASGNTLYFSAPVAPSTSNPIVYAHTQAVQLFVQNDTVVIEPADNPARKFSVELNGIETRFMQMNLQCFNTAKVRSCRVVASPVWTGISLNRTQFAELINCESCCSNIDGIGGQNINTTTANVTTHSSYTRIENCWSHDNYDDGYSEHDRSEAIIIGGLYEWNGKAGVTPSYGEVCTCIDVYSRHNYQGFALVGSVGASGHVNGRNGSTLICYGCVSEANTRGSQQKGFVVMGDGNSAIFVDCIAINEIRGYCALGDARLRLINCSAVDCTTDKYTEGSPTIEIVNAHSVQ